jgi:hypothetical protein
LDGIGVYRFGFYLFVALSFEFISAAFQTQAPPPHQRQMQFFAVMFCLLDALVVGVLVWLANTHLDSTW